jgi:hypothetical protein
MSKLEKLEEKNAALGAELDVLRVALRERDAQAIASGILYAKDTEKIAHLKVELAQAREAIKKAPHDVQCDTYNHLYKDEGVERLLCTCWKRRALTGEKP